MAPLKKVVSDSVEWACLEEAGEGEIGKFIISLDSPGEGIGCRGTWLL
jgi:hypothetical protein